MKQAENLGLDITREGGWNEPADRETVAVLVSQAFNLGGETYEVDRSDFFPDMSADSANAGHLQAVKDFDIFTGDNSGISGTTGTFRGGDGINRAEVAKVMNVAMQNAGDVSKALGDFDLEVELFNAPEDEVFQDGQESVLQKKTSFKEFLKAMIPLLW